MVIMITIMKGILLDDDNLDDHVKSFQTHFE